MPPQNRRALITAIVLALAAVPITLAAPAPAITAGTLHFEDTGLSTDSVNTTTLLVQGKAYVASDIQANGSLISTGAFYPIYELNNGSATFAGTMWVPGSATYNNSLTAAGNLYAGAAARFNSTIAMTAGGSMAGTFSGSPTFSGSLNLTLGGASYTSIGRGTIALAGSGVGADLMSFYAGDSAGLTGYVGHITRTTGMMIGQNVGSNGLTSTTGEGWAIEMGGTSGSDTLAFSRAPNQTGGSSQLLTLWTMDGPTGNLYPGNSNAGGSGSVGTATRKVQDIWVVNNHVGDLIMSNNWTFNESGANSSWRGIRLYNSTLGNNSANATLQYGFYDDGFVTPSTSALGTCDATTRHMHRTVDGDGATTADIEYVCLRSASGTYGWSVIATG